MTQDSADADLLQRFRDSGVYTLCPTAPGAEARLHKRVDILNGGFIVPIGYMGNDREISRSARSCMSIEAEPDRTEEQDRQLIRYLVRKRHTSPLEMLEAKFACKMPIFVARQWIRHRTANVNEMSLRYQPPIDEIYVPEADKIGTRPKSIKQGRSDLALPPDKAARRSR